MEKVAWIKGAVAAIDQYSVDRIVEGLCPYFDLKNDKEAYKNAYYLLKGDYFTYALSNKLKAAKRVEELQNLISALQQIDAVRYKTFKGLKQ